MVPKEHIKTVLTEAGDVALPLVALVGRPNVGKSTLFNRLTRSRRAIIDPTPGMTRDRLYGTVTTESGKFRLVDTGGIDQDPDIITRQIREQTNRAVQEAAVLVFMLDGRESLLASDRDIAAALRQTGKPLILFINKLDGGDRHPFDTDIYQLGFENILTGSAEHALGIQELEIAIESQLGEQPTAAPSEPQEDILRLAIVGRPNVGKSSLVNKLLREERVMVSQVAGTTRDPIDTYLRYRKQTVCLVDTAGIRKRGKIEGSQEHLSVLMAKRQVADADVVALLVDASDPEAVQDAAVAGVADKAFRPVIVVVNKWDLIEDKRTDTPRQFEDRIRRRMKFLESSAFLFVSAHTGQRVSRVLDLALALKARMQKRISTGVLNRFCSDLDKDQRFPTHKGRRLKIFYITQVETSPPTFYLAVNTKEPLHFSQERFLVNRIREAFDLRGIPIKLIIKPRHKKD